MIRELRIQAKHYNHAADVLEGKAERGTTTTTATIKRELSASTRRKMALSQQKRWAVVNKKAA
jgi:hypothetical protein